MENFQICLNTKIIFGKDAQKKVGEQLIENGVRRVLLHYGMESIKKSGLYDEVIGSLREKNIEFVELSKVRPNPVLSLVRAGIDLCRKENVDFILAVGGGSVIDSAKAIAMGVYYEGDVWDFFKSKCAAKKALGVGTILTIPAAGSEVSTATVITNDDDLNNLRKVGYNSEVLIPKFSILNPKLTLTLPKKQIAYGVCDMYAHILERYFSNTPNVDLTDKMCEAVMNSIIKNGVKSIRDPSDYDARSQIMLAGSIAHNNILGVGRVQDWTSHDIEHELSAKYDIAHGEGLAIIFPAWMKFVSKINPSKFIQYGVEVFNLDPKSNSVVTDSIKETEKFFESLGLPTRLSKINIHPSNDDIKFMVEELFKMNVDSNSNNTRGSFVKLNKSDVLEIYNLAL